MSVATSKMRETHIEKVYNRAAKLKAGGKYPLQIRKDTSSTQHIRSSQGNYRQGSAYFNVQSLRLSSCSHRHDVDQGVEGGLFAEWCCMLQST